MICWKSLAYCCSLDKECKERDEYMERIGLSKEEYINLKNNFDKELKKLLDKKCRG